MHVIVGRHLGQTTTFVQIYGSRASNAKTRHVPPSVCECIHALCIVHFGCVFVRKCGRSGPVAIIASVLVLPKCVWRGVGQASVGSFWIWRSESTVEWWKSIYEGCWLLEIWVFFGVEFGFKVYIFVWKYVL